MKKGNGPVNDMFIDVVEDLDFEEMSDSEKHIARTSFYAGAGSLLCLLRAAPSSKKMKNMMGIVHEELLRYSEEEGVRGRSFSELN